MEFILLLCMIFVTISKWLAGYLMSPDSVAYVRAAQTWLAHGALFTTDFQLPDAPLPPHLVPYTVYPPGFPALTALFIKLCGDTVSGTMLLQSLIFIFLFLSLRRALIDLRVGRWMRLPAYIFLFASRVYQENFVYFLTEPLFIALNLQILACAGRLSYATTDSERHKTLKRAALYCLLSPLIRHPGVFSFLVLLLPLSGLRWPRMKKLNWLLSIGALSVVPTILYFLRNLWLTHKINAVHGNVGTYIHWDKYLHFFSTQYRCLFSNNALLAAMTLLFALWGLNTLRKKNGYKAYEATVTTYVAWLLSASTITVMTMLAHSEPAGDRYLSLAMLFFIIALCQTATAAPLRSLIFFLIYFATNASGFYNPMKNWSMGELAAPRERLLWQEIDKNTEIATSRFFVTDYQYTHSIFANRFQIILERIPGEAMPWLQWRDYERKLPPRTPFLYVFHCKSQAYDQLRKELKRDGSGIKFKESAGFCYAGALASTR